MRKLVAVLVTAVAMLALATPAGASRTKHFEGLYTTEEFFDFFTGGCSFLHHVYETVLTTDRGPDGSMRTEACATITDGNLWHGEGTFTVRLPGGSFSGPFVSEARLPATGGGPSAVVVNPVTTGTGRFRGATGSCETAIESITPLEFGHQLQAGAWSCSVSR
jgi:hypothetical protein